MNRPRTITSCLLALTLAITGCATQSSADQQQQPAVAATAEGDPTPSSLPTRTTADEDAEGAEGTTGEQPQAQETGPDGLSSTSPTARPASPSPTGPPPEMDVPKENTVPVSATVEPACVQPGGTATLTVETEPEAGIAYHARYAGNEGGADPPAGKSHGGNDSGFADQDGRYLANWVVSSDAPSGPARVDVIVSTGHEQWGYTSPTFAVADDDGDC